MELSDPEFQFAVADAIAADVGTSSAAFWFHLGDVVYYSGRNSTTLNSSTIPYRDYNAPHLCDSRQSRWSVVQRGDGRNVVGVFVEFLRHGAEPQPGQPGRGADDDGPAGRVLHAECAAGEVYRALLEHGGRQHGGHDFGAQGWECAADVFAAATGGGQAARAAGKWRALVIATHHPPFTGSPEHVPSPTMLQPIDQACTAAGILPDLWLSGHAHVYERYTRTVNGKNRFRSWWLGLAVTTICRD